MSDHRPLWIVLDGTNYAHRDYHAAGAARVGGITQLRLAALQERFRPDRIAVCFDAGECRWRKEIEPQYKANRTDKPADLEQALDDAAHAAIVEAADVLTIDNFEADDVLASLVAIGLGRGCRIVIGSADKDLHQCLLAGSVTQMLQVRRDGDRLDATWMTAERLVDKFGVTPAQWVDYRSMIGDPSDNLGGVPKIGPSTAARILQSTGSLDTFYANPWAANVTDSERTRLFNHKALVMRMRQLMTLRRDVPLPEWSEA